MIDTRMGGRHAAKTGRGWDQCRVNASQCNGQVDDDPDLNGDDGDDYQ